MVPEMAELSIMFDDEIPATSSRSSGSTMRSVPVRHSGLPGAIST